MEDPDGVPGFCMQPDLASTAARIWDMNKQISLSDSPLSLSLFLSNEELFVVVVYLFERQRNREER